MLGTPDAPQRLKADVSKRCLNAGLKSLFANSVVQAKVVKNTGNAAASGDIR